MKLVSYKNGRVDQAALLIEGRVYNIDDVIPYAPKTMQGLLLEWYRYYCTLLQEENKIITGRRIEPKHLRIESVTLLAPVPCPTSLRDGYAFRQHVEAARRNRNVPMIPEFDQYPIFYFSNHHAIKGPGEIACMPDHFEKIGF